MPMEAILIAIGAAVWKLVKELPEIFSGRNKSLREEAEFAEKFLKRIGEEPPLSRFAEEKGYQALAGSRAVSADAVKHVLSIEERPRLLRDYVAGRAYLELSASDGRARLQFTAKYKTEFSRKSRKLVYFALYLFSYFCAMAPLMWAGHRQDAKFLVYFLVAGPAFFILAYLSVAEGHNINCAENVLTAQANFQSSSRNEAALPPTDGASIVTPPPPAAIS